MTHGVLQVKRVPATTHGIQILSALVAVVSALAMPVAASTASEYERGCADFKGGSYDRSSHSDAYEEGWQACKAEAERGSAPSGTPSDQEQACLAAVSRESNNGDVTVLSSEFSQANTVVMIGVGEQRAPWRCLVSNAGHVEEVSFAGSEGNL